jgi:endonuclease/exonuclease/phosphatase family metal-dependent hydrolase
MKANQSGMIIKIIAVFILLFTVLIIFWRRHYINYTDPKGEIIHGDFADSTNAFDGTLQVATWNLHFGENLEEIITTLEKTDELNNADLLLLQEIDEDGVENIARSLHYNYIYYPTVFSRQRGKEYGLAILSSWPLKDSEKILLPNWLPGWVENRYAIKAVASVQSKDITVFNTHLDVAWMRKQGEFLGVELADRIGPAILGGDFNTWQPSSIAALESYMQNIGMKRLTRGTGNTFETNILQFTLDHIFSNQALDYNAGVYRQTDASDHFPVWVEMKMDFGD